MNKRKLKQLKETPSTSKNVPTFTPIFQIVTTLSLWTFQAIIFGKSALREWNRDDDGKKKK